VKEENYIMVGQQKISLRIEIGDSLLPENIMEKHVSNANFVMTHQKHTIVRREFLNTQKTNSFPYKVPNKYYYEVSLK